MSENFKKRLDCEKMSTLSDGRKQATDADSNEQFSGKSLEQ